MCATGESKTEDSEETRGTQLLNDRRPPKVSADSDSGLPAKTPSLVQALVERLELLWHKSFPLFRRKSDDY